MADRDRNNGRRLSVAGLSLATLLCAAVGHAQAPTIDSCQPAMGRYAVAQEREIAIQTPDGTIAGTVAGPADAPPRALALLLHGYTGARDEIPVAGGEGMFARAARAFARRGIATLRIDFIGSGRSDGDWADTRFSTQARDAVRAAWALRARHGAVDLPLGVLGYSQGGLVALRAAASDDEAFDRIALWNPVMDPMTTYGVIFGRDVIAAAARSRSDAPVTQTRLRRGFFEEIVDADPIAEAARADASLLVVTGRRDPLVPDGAALAGRMRAARAAPTAIIDLDAGHDLGALREPALLDAVIACTADFLLGASGQ